MAGFRETIQKALAGFRGSTAVAPTVSVGSSLDDAYYSTTGYLMDSERSYKLRGRQRYKTYNEIVTNTVIVAAGVRYFLNLIANADWTYEPAKDADGEPLPGAEDVAKFVEDVLNDMASPWSKVVRRAARFRFQGFSWQYWTAKRREDGRIGLADVEPRPCVTIDRWDLDDNDNVLGVTQLVNGREQVYLARARSLYLVDDVVEDRPDGTGMLRHVVRSAERLKAYEDLEEIAFETDLRGIPVGRVPLKEMRASVDAGRMTLEAVRKARASVDNFIKNKLLNKSKGLVLDSETYEGTTVDGNRSPSSVRKWDVELLKGDSQGKQEAAAAIDRVNKEIARLLGVEHLMLGSDGTGSLALIGGKLSSFFLVVSSTLNEIAQGADKDLIAPICTLNGIPKELWPKAKPSEIDINDVQAVAQVLSSLATAGATLSPDDPAVDVTRARVGLPPAPPPPELDEADQALVDRMRAGLPVNLNTDPVDPNDPADPQSQQPKPKPVDQKTAKNNLNKLMKDL